MRWRTRGVADDRGAVQRNVSNVSRTDQGGVELPVRLSWDFRCATLDLGHGMLVRDIRNRQRERKKKLDLSVWELGRGERRARGIRVLILN